MYVVPGNRDFIIFQAAFRTQGISKTKQIDFLSKN